jgi:hypothetical protein
MKRRRRINAAEQTAEKLLSLHFGGSIGLQPYEKWNKYKGL